MSIHTRFGSQIKLLTPVDSEGWVKVERLSDGRHRQWHVSELRANGGIAEIETESRRLELIQ